MFALTLTAELDGVTALLPVDTQESPFLYTFRVQCTSCREIHPNLVSVSRFVCSASLFPRHEKSEGKYNVPES